LWNQVQSRVKNLREIASQDAVVVQQGLEKIQQEAVTANGRLNAFIATADATSVEDSALLASKVSKMEDILVSWYVIVFGLKFIFAT
jgi:kinesin family protein 11